MRIAITIPRLDPTRGGAEVATLRLIEELAQRGHQVDVLSCSCTVPLPAGGRHVVMPNPLPILGWRAFVFARAVAAQLRHSKYDISIACGRGYAEDVIWAHSGATVRRRLQFLVSPRLWFYALLDRRRFERVPPPHIIAVSGMVAAEFQRQHGLPAEHIHVINNIGLIDTERFSPARRQQLRLPARHELGLRDDQFVVLFMGNDLRRKGLRPLLEALALARSQWSALCLLVAGSNEQRHTEYERLARKLGCAGAVRFVPHRANPVEMYAAADVFCLPSFYDPCALVTIEAMACGLPVITSRTNGAAELMRHGEDGLILDSAGDVDALAALLFQLRDEKRRRQLGSAARAKFMATRQAADSPSLPELIEELAAAKAVPVSAAA